MIYTARCYSKLARSAREVEVVNLSELLELFMRVGVKVIGAVLHPEQGAPVLGT